MSFIAEPNHSHFADFQFGDITMDDVKYPQVEVTLTGQDGNAFMILGLVTKAMRRAGLSADDIKEYTDEATAGDYDHLLRTTMQTVQVF